MTRGNAGRNVKSATLAAGAGDCVIVRVCGAPTIVSEERCRQPSCAVNLIVHLGVGIIRVDTRLHWLWDIGPELFFEGAQGFEELSSVKESLLPSRILIREFGEILRPIEHV